MSFVARTSIHLITVLERGLTIGTAMGAKYDFKPGNPPLQYRCCVTPIEGRELVQLMERGMVSPHRIRFHERPYGIDETKRLRWEDASGLLSPTRPRLWNTLTKPAGARVGFSTIFRVMSLPRDSSGLGRQWIMLAEALTEDQPQTFIQ
jgi:hypothetical protein